MTADRISDLDRQMYAFAAKVHLVSVLPTGAALHDNNDASEKVTTQYGRPIVYVKVKCHFTAEIVRV